MRRFKILFPLTSVAALVLMSSNSYATQHIIKFGGSLGYDYSPESLTVQVGDTIVWLGSFSKHPMTLTKAPANAARFRHIDSGESYQYVVSIPGVYEYQCDKHADEGMEGSFTAVAGGTKFERVP